MREYGPIDKPSRDETLALVHPYGSVRPMRLLDETGQLGYPVPVPVPVRPVGLAPLTDPRARFMLIVPEPPDVVRTPHP